MIELDMICHEDYQLVAQWLSDPSINEWLIDWRGKIVTETIIGIVAMNPRNRLFVIKNAGRKCGLVALGDIDEEVGSADIWYFLGDSSLSGQGVISQGLGLLIEFCRANLGLKLLTAQTMSNNRPSMRILEKHDFRKAGFLNDGQALPSEGFPRISYELHL